MRRRRAIPRAAPASDGAPTPTFLAVTNPPPIGDDDLVAAADAYLAGLHINIWSTTHWVINAGQRREAAEWFAQEIRRLCDEAGYDLVRR